MKGIFVLGTDTGVGKTLCSAILLETAIQLKIKNIRYFKPIQTYIEQECDAREVKKLVSKANNYSITRGLEFPRPLSPHLAAHYQNTNINFLDLISLCEQELNLGFTILEGAGGILSPINFNYTPRDLAHKLNIPVVLVTRSSLGTINHSLLTIEALRSKNIPILGVIMSGKENKDNLYSVKYFAKINNIINIPKFNKLNSNIITDFTQENLDKLKLFLGEKHATRS